MLEPRIVVLGAGPAGAATAIGLRRLGYPVTVVSEWRRFAAVEGVSQRVLEGLRHAGLGGALSQAAMPAARQVHWNGQHLQMNQEFLLDRQRFDRALRDDLQRAGVSVVEGRVREVAHEGGHRIRLDDGQVLLAGFLVEARGRQAPLATDRLRGPETVSLLNVWQGSPAAPASAVQSLEDGWAWMARLEDGRCYWQVTLDAAGLPGKAGLAEYCAARRARSALVAELFDAQALAPAPVHARSSTAILAGECVGPDWIRVGDAAMAVDPLSGNGIFSRYRRRCRRQWSSTHCCAGLSGQPWRGSFTNSGSSSCFALCPDWSGFLRAGAEPGGAAVLGSAPGLAGWARVACGG